MNNDYSDITQMAMQAISDEDLVLQQYATPEAVLDYLQNESNFKTLSDQLKETMCQTGLCTPQSTTGDCVDILYSSLVEQDITLGRTDNRPRNNVRRWLNGQFKYIRNRRDLIEICFALKLSLPFATALLNKCGSTCFHVRVAQDAIYMYCLLNHRSLADADHLFQLFLTNNNSAVTVNETSKGNSDVPDVSHSGETTFQMELKLMENASWNSDEEFLHTFLFPNREKFIGFSITAVHEYNKLKNALYLIALKKWLTDEDENVRRKLLDEHNRKQHYKKYQERLSPAVPATEVRITLNLENALKKHMDNIPFLQTEEYLPVARLEKTGNGHFSAINNAPAICDRIHNEVLAQKEDTALQKEVSMFLSDILSADRVFFQILPTVIGGNDSRKRAYGESVLKDTVLRLFPHRQTFTDFEKSPATSQPVSIRKAIILMYYIVYAYEFRSYMDDYTYSSALFSQMGFAEFFDGLNHLLERCRLSPLYPGNQYDWLILRSIREFEIGDPDEDDSNPIAFFNDVLEMSFSEEDF